MTTVIASNETLVTDSCCVYEHNRKGLMKKIYPLYDGSIMAYAGSMETGYLFFNYMNELKFYTDSKEKPKIPDIENDDFVALVFTKKKDSANFKTKIYYNSFLPCSVGVAGASYYGIGSGSDFALGYLGNSSSLVDAVLYACNLDIYSSSPIVTFKLKKYFEELQEILNNENVISIDEILKLFNKNVDCFLIKDFPKFEKYEF